MIKKIALLVSLILFTFFFSPSPIYAIVFAEDLTVNPDKDSSVVESEVYVTRGYLPVLSVGNGNEVGGNLTMALVHFNLSQIPSGAIINSAKLRLFYRGTLNFPAALSSVIINAYRITGDWEESGPNAVKMSNLPSFAAEIKSTITMNPNQPNVFTEWEITDFVKGWYNNTYPNYGLILRRGSGTNYIWTVQFDSKEGDVHPPELGVNYTQRYRVNPSATPTPTPTSIPTSTPTPTPTTFYSVSASPTPTRTSILPSPTTSKIITTTITISPVTVIPTIKIPPTVNNATDSSNKNILIKSEKNNFSFFSIWSIIGLVSVLSILAILLLIYLDKKSRRQEKMSNTPGENNIQNGGETNPKSTSPTIFYLIIGILFGGVLVACLVFFIFKNNYFSLSNKVIPAPTAIPIIAIPTQEITPTSIPIQGSIAPNDPRLASMESLLSSSLSSPNYDPILASLVEKVTVAKYETSNVREIDQMEVIVFLKSINANSPVWTFDQSNPVVIKIKNLDPVSFGNAIIGYTNSNYLLTFHLDASNKISKIIYTNDYRPLVNGQ